MEIAAFESLTKQCFIKRGIALNLPPQLEFLFPQAVIFTTKKHPIFIKRVPSRWPRQA